MRPYKQFGLAALLGAAVCVLAPHTSAQQTAGQQGSAQAPTASGQSTPAGSTTADTPKTPPSDPGMKVPGTGSDPTGGKKQPEAKKDAKSDQHAEKNDAIPSPGEDLDPHIKKGSEDDVDAIGTREIGHRGLGNWYSVNSEISMGKQYSMEIEKSAHLVTDPVVVEYVNRIGQNIVKNSDCKVPFTIKVIDSDEINAMALPGGFFYVNSGLLLNADEEAELAGVMAHETAHVCAHHAVREQTRMNYAQLGTIPLIMMTGYSWTGYGIYEATQFAVPLTFLKFSRDFEAQADYLGIQYMYRSGYDPQAFISFFEKVQALEKRKPGLVAKAFSDHPQTPDRILHSQDEIAKILPARDEYTVTTSEFDDVKGRLARIENKRRLLDTKDKNKPSLRRASTTDDKNGQAGQGKDGDDRPTLHRRDDQNQ